MAWLEAQDRESGLTNLERMTQGKVTASERRELFTKFLGAAWDHVLKNFDFIHSGEKTGCALDVNGEKMSQIN